MFEKTHFFHPKIRAFSSKKGNFCLVGKHGKNAAKCLLKAIFSSQRVSHDEIQGFVGKEFGKEENFFSPDDNPVATYLRNLQDSNTKRKDIPGLTIKLLNNSWNVSRIIMRNLHVK